MESRTIIVTESEEAAKSDLKLGKIHLVDLAGSERLGMSAAEGERMVETQSINKSLSALGTHRAALLVHLFTNCEITCAGMYR